MPRVNIGPVCRVVLCVCVCGGGGVLISGANISLLTYFTHLYFHENNMTIRILGYVEALHTPPRDSLVVAPNVKFCKVIDKVMSRTLEWIARDSPIDEHTAKTRHSSLAEASTDDHHVHVF